MLEFSQTLNSSIQSLFLTPNFPSKSDKRGRLWRGGGGSEKPIFDGVNNEFVVIEYLNLF